MFTVYLTNFGHYLADDFATFDEALAAAKKACFEAQIFRGDLRVAAWSPIGGLRRFAGAER